jgi:hypothetical protein
VEVFVLIGGPVVSDRMSPINPGRFRTAPPLEKGAGGIWIYRFGLSVFENRQGRFGKGPDAGDDQIDDIFQLFSLIPTLPPGLQTRRKRPVILHKQ